MHCNEAERRLTHLESKGLTPRDDAELNDHLASCPKCAKLAEASRLLGRAFDDLRTADVGQSPAFAWVKSRIMAEAATHRKEGRIADMFDKIWNPQTGRTRRRVSLAVVAVVLAFVTLVPFHYQRTVGYEVAFAGVNKDLAMDQDKLELLLSKLGIGGATVDLGACEATCSLVVSNLKSKDQCQMLVYAMKELGNCSVVSEGDEVCEPASGSLVKLAGQQVLFVSDGSDPQVVQARVMECLGEDFPEGLNVWVTRCDSAMTVAVEGTKSAMQSGHCADSSAVCSLMVNLSGTCCMGDSGAIERCILICKSDSMACLPGGPGMQGLKSLGVDLSSSNGEIDAETRAKLEALGFDVQVEGGEGTRSVKIIKRDGAGATALSGDTEDAQAAKEAVVPEGYALDQNYPNPFNPSTSISFTIARQERVKVEIVNVLGQRVRTLVDQVMPAGPHEVQWDATSDDGQRVPSGTYLYRITAGDFSASRTMTLLK
jgi:hypothetical protein